MATFRQKGHSNPDSITEKTPAQKLKNKSATMKITSIMWRWRLNLHMNKRTTGIQYKVLWKSTFTINIWIISLGMHLNGFHTKKRKQFCCPPCQANAPDTYLHFWQSYFNCRCNVLLNTTHLFCCLFHSFRNDKLLKTDIIKTPDSKLPKYTVF